MSPTATVARDVTGLASRMRLVVMRLARQVRQETLGGDVTQSMLSALASIDRRGPITLGDLAAVERVRPPSMTKVVARLEDAGFVAREVDAFDRRVVRVQVTAAGHRFAEEARRRGSEYLAARLKTLGPEERAVVEAALPVLERLLEEDE